MKLPICRQNKTNMTTKTSLFVAKLHNTLKNHTLQMLPICRHLQPHSPTPLAKATKNANFRKQKIMKRQTTSLFVANMFPICRQRQKHAPYLSPTPSQSVAAMLPICRTTFPKCRQQVVKMIMYQRVTKLY